MVYFVSATVNYAVRCLRSKFVLYDAFMMETIGVPTRKLLLVTFLLIHG